MWHRLSVASLLAGEPVVVAEANLETMVCDETELSPEELLAIQKAVAHRRHEFVAGRLLARAAMSTLGITQQPVPSGQDRAPLWPEGTVGSITHTKTWCAVALAHAHDLRSVGVDVEMEAPIAPNIWSRICTPGELAWVRSLPALESGLACKMLFSAKESVYKAQYPLTRQFLGFQAVEVELDREAGLWRAVFRQSSGGHIFEVGDVLEGRVSCGSGLIATSLVVPH